MLKFYYAPDTVSLASHVALEEAGGEYNAQLVDFKINEQRSPEFLKVNPKGRVPALVTDEGILTETPPILYYICRKFPNAGLMGECERSSFTLAEMQSFHSFLATSVHVAFAHIFRPARYGEGDAAAAAMREKSGPSIHAFFDMIEEKLADGRPFVHGERFTITDPYLLVFSRWIDRAKLGPIDRFPFIAAHRRRIEARPSTQKILALG
ncbi:glutathione S-transferase family protein [[Pseudomonas] carboxydohydrogena]|uniref:Glutathione S-transferase family protein n=1 Tax=Afipia carboxydohydrogena TaxID=290 RepID=A0ABY8BLW0_AFICR|nr:glutathione S-transferase family protein [[Pseudomonas] carboxydohydrogena]WEF50978.1 glutathione S-transferase family protein [[Pseudomonas] carboxydohydrogena]